MFPIHTSYPRSARSRGRLSDGPLMMSTPEVENMPGMNKTTGLLPSVLLLLTAPWGMR